jgi:hypothetical protein
VAEALTAKSAVTNDAAVLSPLHQLRAPISALLLLVQVVGLGHVALGRHELNEHGAIVDVAPPALEPHEATEGHLCAGDVTIHADAPGDCLVLAGWSAASLVTPPVALRRAPQHVVRVTKTSSFVAVQLEVLSRAPKASPPLG